jgi:methionyl-tRNA formyltransferase
VTRARWAVFAYHTIGARALEALVARGEDVAVVVTHADDADEGAWFESVADVARIHRIPCLTPTSPNLPEVAETLRELAPDLILSVWYRRLLGPELLADRASPRSTCTARSCRHTAGGRRSTGCS